MADRLSTLDMTYLIYDAGPMPINAGALTILNPAEDSRVLTADRLTALLAERCHLLRRYRQVPTRTPLGIWVWTEDRDFDLARHVRHHRLRPPGAAAELASLVTRIHTRSVDPAHPLWEKHTIEGLAGGRSALLMKWNHALVDGMSAIEVIKTLFDTSPQPATPGTGRGAPVTQSARRRDDSGAPGAVREWPDIAADLDRAAAVLDGWIAQLKVIRGRRWFQETSGAIRLGFGTIPDEALRKAARAARVGLDVAFLTVVAAGVSDVLASRERVKADDVIRTVVPMAIPVRARRDVLGNHATIYSVPLPIGPMPITDRLSAVAEAIANAKPAEQVASLAVLQRFDHVPDLLRVPDWLVATASRVIRGPGLVDLLVTYVRGPRQPLWLSGFPHVSTHPVMPLGPFINVMVGGANLGGRVGLSVTADRAALPELDFLLHRMERAALSLAGG